MYYFEFCAKRTKTNKYFKIILVIYLVGATKNQYFFLLWNLTLHLWCLDMVNCIYPKSRAPDLEAIKYPWYNASIIQPYLGNNYLN